tara:strand:- start:369 stop:743 length:375 start_codon:yes stop_codon:yes gene_type:complete
MKDENDKKTQELNLENSVGRDNDNWITLDIANVLESSIRKIINQEMKSLVENYNVLTEQNFHDFIDGNCDQFVTQDTFIDELANNDIPCRDEIVDHDNVADIVEQAMQDYFLTNSFILKKGDKK